MHEGVLDQVGHHLLDPAGVGQHLEAGGDVDLHLAGVPDKGQCQVDGVGQVDGPQVEHHRTGFEPAHVEQVVGQTGDALGLAADGHAHVLYPLGGELVGVGLEGRPQAQDGGQRVAQVVGDQGEELVLGLVEIASGGDVTDDALEAGQHPVLEAGGGRHLEHPPHAVGPGNRELGPHGLVGRRGEPLDHGGRVERRHHLGDRRLLQVLGRPAQDHAKGRVDERHAAVEVDLEDAVRRLFDDVLVVGPGLLLASHHRFPVALGHGIGEAVHGGQHAREKQRQGQAPMTAALLGHLDRRLHDQVAGDAQDHE